MIEHSQRIEKSVEQTNLMSQGILKDFDNLISEYKISEILRKLGFFDNPEFSISDEINQKQIGERISRLLNDRPGVVPGFYRSRENDHLSQHMMYVDGRWQNRSNMISKQLEMSVLKQEALKKNIIKKFVPNLDTISFSKENGINVFLKDKPEQSLSLGSFGYGFQRSVISYMLCMLNKDSVLGIDEFENGLHFDKQSMFAKELIEASITYNTQLFLTSHSDKSAILFLEEIKNAKQEHNFSAIKLVKQDNSVVHSVYDFESTYRILTRGMNNPNDPFKLA